VPNYLQKPELDVLVKRYEIVNKDKSRSVDTKRLVDDLVLGKVAPTWGGPPDPKQAATDALRLTELTTYIGGQLARSGGPQALFGTFSAAERGGGKGGVISVQSFTAALTRAGVHLKPAEESLLTAHYAAPGGYGDIEYRSFLEDLRRADKGGGRPAVALTQGQRDLIDNAKTVLERAPKA
jgi:hypothetical protein